MHLFFSFQCTEAIYIDANGLEIPFRSEIQFTQHLSAAAASGAVVSCPYYNSMLGIGWACLTSSNQRGFGKPKRVYDKEQQ